MKLYRIIAGYYVNDTVSVEDYQCEQDALDKIIDKLDAAEYTGCFCDPNKYNDDEYVIGGNHCLALYHGGNLIIQEITE